MHAAYCEISLLKYEPKLIQLQWISTTMVWQVRYISVKWTTMRFQLKLTRGEYMYITQEIPQTRTSLNTNSRCSTHNWVYWISTKSQLTSCFKNCFIDSCIDWTFGVDPCLFACQIDPKNAKRKRGYFAQILPLT